MSFPASLTTRTVKGRFVTYPAGTPAKGKVRIVLNDFMQGPTDDTFVAPFDRNITLDANGEFSVILPATNDPQWTSSYYKVTITADEQTVRSKFELPYNSTDALDLADVLNLPAPTPGESYILYASKGVAGGVASLGSDGKVPADQLPPGAGGTVHWADVADKPTTFPHDEVTYGQVTGKPALFPPVAHDHPISNVTGLQTALDGKSAVGHGHVLSDTTGLASALAAKADLVSGVIPTAQIPSISVVDFLGSVSTQSAMLALVGQKGDWCIRTDLGKTYVITGSDPTQLSSWTAMPLPSVPVQSVNGQIGDVVLAKSDVGLVNVDNTSDANKPVSTAQQTALNLKVDKTIYTGEKVFSTTFSTAANEKRDIYFAGAPTGLIEVTITGQFTGQNAFGVIRATYALGGLSNGTIYVNTLTPDISEGAIQNEFALLPASWDASNSRWKIPVVHRTANSNPVLIRVTWQQTTSTAAASIDSTISISSIYTTDTTPGLALSPSHRTHTRATGEILASDPYYGTPGTRAAFINALDAAETLALRTVVKIPVGLTVDVLTGLSMSGRTAQIIGDGAGITGGGTPTASVIKASTQTGPVLDYTGYIVPGDAGWLFSAKIRPLANIMIQGSGVADPAKVNHGIKITKMSSAYFHDIAIRQTGGSCLYLAENPGNATYLCDFDRIILNTPVSAQVNDVPYFYMNEGNGNRFRSLGFRSQLSSNDTGISGAAIIEGNATYAPYSNKYDAWWFEFLHINNGGTLFHHKGNHSAIQDFQFHDVINYASLAAGGGTFYRLSPPSVGDTGANDLRGDIALVDIRQSGNSVIGTRNSGEQVILAAGVNYTTARISGGVKTSTGSTFIDNSGTTTNVLIDDFLGEEIRGGKTVRSGHALKNTFLGNQSTPSTPTGGGTLYVESGVLKYIGPSGQVTVIGAA